MSRALREAAAPLAVFGNGLGDHLLALPALRALAHGFGGRLTLLCPRAARRRFFADLPLAATIEAPLRDCADWYHATLREALPACDLLVWLNPWRSSLVDLLLDHLAGRPAVGFPAGSEGFTHPVALDYGKHAADLTFDVARRIFPELRLEDFARPPALPVGALQAAGRVRARLGPARRLLVVQADTLPEKEWIWGRFRVLLDRFLGEHPEYFVALVGRADRGLEGGPHAGRIVSLLGAPLTVSMAVVAEADLFLGIDSCFLHAADLFRVPGVGLFGATAAQEFGFRLDGVHRHVEGAGMEAITVEAVHAALAEVLADSARRPRARPAEPTPGAEEGGHVYQSENRCDRVGLRRSWSVPRLWETAAGLPVRQVAVADLDLDRSRWFDEGEQPTTRQIARHCRRIVEADLGHPIILSAGGQVMDGVHRLARAWLEGRPHIDAVQFAVDPPPDFIEIRSTTSSGR